MVTLQDERNKKQGDKDIQSHNGKDTIIHQTNNRYILNYTSCFSHNHSFPRNMSHFYLIIYGSIFGPITFIKQLLHF